MSRSSNIGNTHALATQINELVKDVWVAIEREGPSYDEFDLTSTQHVVLGLIVTQPGITASELADALDVTRGAISQHLTVLEDGRYISRRRSKRDGRSQVLELDRRGREYQEKLQAFEQFATDRYLSRLSPDDLSDIVAALQNLKTALDHQ